MALNDVLLVPASRGPRGLTLGSATSGWGDPSGATVVIDFFAKAILDGAGHQVRAGTISVPLVGDVVITDTAAEYCVDGSSGLVIIPVFQNISVSLGTGTLHEYATKSVGTASTSGTVFLPLPLLSGGAAASATARVQAAGTVTVTAEAATTTLRHWSWGQPIAMGAYAVIAEWEPLRPPVIRGDRCLYTQIAATGTGPSYYANLDFIEFAAAQLQL